jgi:hypothetical protein
LSEDLILVYDGFLTLQVVVININNTDESHLIQYNAIEVHGSLAVVTIEYCKFKTVNPILYIDLEILELEKGGNLTMHHVSIENIRESHKPILSICVSERSSVSL